MRVLFLTLIKTIDISSPGIYNDLLREFHYNGHEIFVVSPAERRFKENTQLIKTNNATILNVKTLNIQKSNLIEKGIGTLLLEHQYLKAIKRFFKNQKFDLILYSTPPITFATVVEFIKNRDNAYTYLLLKDIFPQNAVDIGYIKKSSLFYKFFRNKEINLYNISDKIGCMSKANVNYILDHNPNFPKDRIEVCPNSITLKEIGITSDYERKKIRSSFGIYNEATLLVYGGNLGKPQGIDFLVDILNEYKNDESYFFLIVGDGTEYNKLKFWFDAFNPTNVRLIKTLPKEEYDNLLKICDVGLIFLDVRFTIPNYPSRILSYMENSMPILAATDISTDLKNTLEVGDFGFWSESGDIITFGKHLQKFRNRDIIRKMGENALNYLKKNYTSTISYNIIMKNFN